MIQMAGTIVTYELVLLQIDEKTKKSGILAFCERNTWIKCIQFIYWNHLIYTKKKSFKDIIKNATHQWTIRTNIAF